jgi:hypothetical protein
MVDLSRVTEKGAGDDGEWEMRRSFGPNRVVETVETSSRSITETSSRSTRMRRRVRPVKKAGRSKKAERKLGMVRHQRRRALQAGKIRFTIENLVRPQGASRAPGASTGFLVNLSSRSWSDSRLSARHCLQRTSTVT